MADRERNSPDSLTHEAFLDRLGARYSVVRAGEPPVELELTEVSERKATQKLESFAVYFRGPVDLMLPQGTYRLESESHGTLDLFLVAVDRDEDGIRYEAIFNTLIRSE